MQTIQAFIDANASTITQRSPEWYEARATCIGGSEVAILLGQNPYSTIDKLIQSKCGLEKRWPSAACAWGTLFEPLIGEFVEHDCGTTIMGSNIWIRGAGRFSLSPDGYGVFSLFFHEDADKRTGINKIGISTARTPRAKCGQAICLVEFKCPYQRIPTSSIPPQYAPQVLLGLEMSSIARFGVFCDAVFRRCSREQFAWDKEFARTTAREWSCPLAMGVLFLYTSIDTIADTPYTGDVVDYGAVDVRQFETLLLQIENKQVSVVYSPMIFPPAAPAIPPAPEHQGIHFGIVPWKLFQIEYAMLKRDPEFMPRVLPEADRVCEIIERIRSAPTVAIGYGRYLQQPVDDDMLADLMG